MRWEVRIHNFGLDLPAYPNSLVNLGPVRLMKGYATNVITASMGENPAGTFDVIYNNGPEIIGCCSAWTDVLIRVQRDVANARYTLEACSVTGGSCMSGTAPLTKIGPASWVGGPLNLASGGQIAFVRWYSSVVPLGTPIPVNGAAGDLADWEFEGNLQDSSGHGLNFSGGGVSYVPTPIYPPVCNPGTQQSFRAGYPADLAGSASAALDGGTFLSYVWQLASGPPGLNWSSHSAANPQIRGLVFGSYVFQLTVTDSSNQSSVCTVKHGAVATDDNNIVVTNNPAVDTLLGPMVRYGANPWPWFDNRNKQAADNQNSIMDVYFPAWWDTPGPGTITVTTNSTEAIGVGTTFTTTFCQGPAAPTVAQNGNPMIAIWHPLGSGTGRVMAAVVSCVDDTHLVMDQSYSNWASGTIVQPGSGLTYAADNQYAVHWGWSQAASPANYYDNVAAYYAFYYRSGIDDYLTAARKLADRFWESPMIDQGVQTPGYSYTGRSMSAMGLVLRALDGRPDMWAGAGAGTYSGLHNMWDVVIGSLNGNDVGWEGPRPSLWDQREVSYHLAMVSYCALFDIDPTYQSKCQAVIVSSFPTLWTPTKFPDGSWSVMYASSDSWTTSSSVTMTHGSIEVTGVGPTGWAVFNGGTYTGGIAATGPSGTTCLLTITNGGGTGGAALVALSALNTIASGSTLTVAASGSGFMTDPTAATAAPGGSTPATTCSGTAVIAGQLAAIPPSRIWFTPTPATEPANNSVGDPVSYGATFVDSAHLTLDSPYQGTSGTHGWETAGITGWASQPYMMGILSWAFDLAAKAVATVSPTTASLSHSYSVAAANWIKTYGYWPAAKGMYYTVGGPDCKYPISDSNTLCTAGFAPDQARTLSAEAMRGLDLAYAYSQDSSIKSLTDTLYNAMWAKPGTCPTGSATCVSDGTYLDPMDDGQYMSAVPPLGSLGTATPWKWLGLLFGVSAQSSWPGYRVGGLQPRVNEPLYIGGNLPGVPGGATAARVLTTDPSGVTYTTNCSALPCMVTVDHRQGDHLVSIQYLSATGTVLASSQVPLIGGQ
jgi:hypothetical protein